MTWLFCKTVDEINTSRELLCINYDAWSLKVNAHNTRRYVYFW